MLGVLQQARAFLASVTLSLAALLSSLALSFRGFSQAVLSFPFLSAQDDRSGLAAALAAVLASSTAFCCVVQSGLAAASAANAAEPKPEQQSRNQSHERALHRVVSFGCSSSPMVGLGQ